jgi:predicted nucleic-acid-binding protein
MLAVDTNVLVRMLVRDNVQQHEQAVRIFGEEHILLMKSVLLEAEWVLRFSYKFKPAEVAQAFEATLSLPNVTCDCSGELRQALVWHRAGMDFADALHLASMGRAERFVTFDQAMIKIANRLDLPVAAP